LTVPLAVIPERVHGMAVVTALNRILARAVQDGELDFLAGRTVHIRVRDLQLGFCLTLRQGVLAACRVPTLADLSISGTLHAFLLLAARHEDADTLFFQRRLRMEGDTELGLEVKNFLDGLDVDALWLPRQASRLARRTLPLFEHTFGR
jgi:predicted lipid carrier protein YhbT